MNTTGRKVVAIDVDLTVVDALGPWLSWIKRSPVTDFEPFPIHDFFYSGDWLTQYDKMTEYTLRGIKLIKSDAEYQKRQDEVSKDWMGYWRQADLYRTMTIPDPIRDAIFKLKRNNDQVDILFVSHCMPEHKQSKLDLLTTHFGPQGKKWNFIDTRLKEFVNYDLIIEDNPVVLKECATRNPSKAHVMVPDFFLKTVSASGEDTYPHLLPMLSKHFGNSTVHVMRDWSELGNAPF